MMGAGFFLRYNDPMIDIKNLSLSFGEHVIFRGLNLQIPSTARLGIVGSNGAGKTTLLRVIMGELEPDSGVVERSRGLTVGCLPQDLAELDPVPLMQYLKDKAGISRIESKLRAVEDELSRSQEQNRKLAALIQPDQHKHELPEIPQKPSYLLSLLRQHFGFDNFRPGQEEIIDALLSGRDVFCSMPENYGKSICYRLPALLMPGVTLAVTPYEPDESLITPHSEILTDSRPRSLPQRGAKSSAKSETVRARYSIRQCSSSQKLTHFQPSRSQKSQ